MDKKRTLNLQICTTGIPATGGLIRNIMLSLSELELDSIVQRTQKEKQIVRSKPVYRGGRSKKYSRAQENHTLLYFWMIILTAMWRL